MAAVATPELIELEPATARIVRTDAEPPGHVELYALLGANDGRPVSYATSARPEFVEDLLRRLLSASYGRDVWVDRERVPGAG